MSTKFDLEYPYTTRWNVGYIVTNGENRKNVCLVGDNGRSTTSYARYLVSVSQGRFLEDWEHVDHINHDKTDDRLENLQILTLAENNRKEAKRKGRLLAEICCPVCETIFTRRKGNTQAIPANKGKVTCCTKECSNTFKNKNYPKNVREKISENSLIRVFSLKG